ncbi:hypothetical protein EXIGLDRAFT_706715, partial [Exidia glandulosa HHB12029]
MYLGVCEDGASENRDHPYTKAPPKPKPALPPPKPMVEAWMSNVVLPELFAAAAARPIPDEIVLEPTGPASGKTPFVFQHPLYSDKNLSIKLDSKGAMRTAQDYVHNVTAPHICLGGRTLREEE